MLASSENENPMEQSNGTRWERPDAPLGTLVYRAGLLSKEKLEAALEEGQRSGRRLGEILLQKGWIDEKDLARLLAGQKGLQFVSLKGRGYERETAKLLPERVCRYHNALPVEASGERILVAIADPTDEGALAEIRDELGRPIELVVATTSEIRSALDEIFATAAPPAPAEASPSVSPVGELGLRIAVPAPVSEPEPPAAPEPAPEADPVVAAVPEPAAAEPEPATTPEPVVTALPDPAPQPVPEPRVSALPDPIAHPDPEPQAELDVPAAPELPAVPAVPAAPELPAVPAVPVPTLESITHALPDPLPSASEPTIERNEEAHVSVAFNTPAVAEPAPDPELESLAPPEPVPTGPQPVADASDHRPTPAAAPYCLVLNLVDGEQVDVAYFAEPAEATAAARALVAGITRDAEWPQVGRTFYPPERIASVEIREPQRFGGNAARAGWGGDDRPAS